MLFLSITPLLAAIALILLAILVRSRAPRDELNEAFVFVATMMCFWNLNFFILYSVHDHGLASVLSRTLRTGTLFLPPAILHLHLLLALEQSRTERWKVLLWANYLFGAILAIANGFDILVRDLRPVSWGFASVGTRYYNIFTVFIVGNALASLCTVGWQFSKAANPRIRQQLRFWVIGAAIALPLGLMNLLPAYGVSIYPPGNLGTAAWAAIVAYAIIRHRLLGIEVVITKTLAYAAVTSLLISPVLILSLFMQRWAFGAIHADFSAALFVMLLFVGVLFPRMRTWAESHVERSLFREKLAAHQALSVFAQSVIRIFDKRRIARELCRVIADAFGARTVSLYIFEAENERYALRESTGGGATALFLAESSSIVRFVSESGGPMLRSEIESQLVQGAHAVELGAEIDSWDVLVPLLGPKSLIGFLCLGAKSDREAYSAGDLELLGRVGAEATFALENARLYEELQKSQQLIDRAGRLSALGTLAAGIAHEVRNPLVSIQTFFQLAPQRLHDEEFMTSFLKLAEEEVDRIRNLISELLSFARSSEAVMREIVVQDVVTRTLMLMTPQARESRVLLVTDDLPTRAVTIQADPDQLVQVIVNLVLNAIQATPEGGEVRVGLTPAMGKDSSYCEIAVSDTGPGIPVDARESIFNPFFTTKESGTGLGLAIAYRIIADYGGNISVSDTPVGGACFRVRLPLAVGAGSLAEAVGAR